MPGSIRSRFAALLFLFVKTLRRPYLVDEIPSQAVREAADRIQSGGSRAAAIVRCRTVALVGHLDPCFGCGHLAISFNSYRNRHCQVSGERARKMADGAFY